jgi:hypothetical protein
VDREHRNIEEEWVMGWASEVQALLDRAAADDVVPVAVAVATQPDGST